MNILAHNNKDVTTKLMAWSISNIPICGHIHCERLNTTLACVTHPHLNRKIALKVDRAVWISWTLLKPQFPLYFSEINRYQSGLVHHSQLSTNDCFVVRLSTRSVLDLEIVEWKSSPNTDRNRTHSADMIDWFIDWGLMALSAQIGYIVPFISMLQLKSEINEKVDDGMRWECIQ